jgi:RecA/RadA recombinase
VHGVELHGKKPDTWNIQKNISKRKPTKMAEKEPKKEKCMMEKLRDELDKGVKGAHISILSKSEIARISSWINSPSYDLNRIISGSIYKGVPEKSFTLLVGPEASFKSSCMAIMAAEAQKNGYLPVIIDTEGSWTHEFTGRWGLDGDNALYAYTPWIDDIMVLLGKIIKNPEYRKLAILLDSVGGLERLKLIEDAFKGDVKADQGTLQKDIKRMLKMVVNICKARESVGFAGGHLYGNPSQYGEPEQLGGGKYLRHAADLIIALKKSTIKDGDGKDAKIIGTSINAVTRKNRFYPPYNEATVEINYRDGINKFAGMFELALEGEIFTGGGAGWYTHVESGEKFQGASKFSEWLQKNSPDVILNQIESWIRKTGYSSINVNVAEAEELLKKSEDFKKTEEEWIKDG